MGASCTHNSLLCTVTRSERVADGLGLSGDAAAAAAFDLGQTYPPPAARSLSLSLSRPFDWMGKPIFLSHIAFVRPPILTASFVASR